MLQIWTRAPLSSRGVGECFSIVSKCAGNLSVTYQVAQNLVAAEVRGVVSYDKVVKDEVTMINTRKGIRIFGNN